MKEAWRNKAAWLMAEKAEEEEEKLAESAAAAEKRAKQEKRRSHREATKSVESQKKPDSHSALRNEESREGSTSF